MRLLVERFRQDKERTRSESKLRKLIDDVRGKHGVLLKSKRKRPDNITVYFSWYNCTPNGKKKFSQVKVNSGGGVRQKILPRSSNFNFCFPEAKNIYFLNQSNPVKGLLSNYCCELYSCNLQPLKETMDNGEMFSLDRRAMCLFFYEVIKLFIKPQNFLLMFFICELKGLHLIIFFFDGLLMFFLYFVYKSLPKMRKQHIQTVSYEVFFL